MDDSLKKCVSQFQVDSDPTVLSPPTNPNQNGKRDAEKVVEDQFKGNKKQKIINGATETEESKEVEIFPSIKSVATTVDIKKASSLNDSEQEDEAHDNSMKENDLHLETPKKSIEVPLVIKSATTTQDAERAGISNEYDEDTDDGSLEEHQHLQSSMKNAQTQISSQATGSKTVLMDNLSFSIEEEDAKNFFKNVGDITEVHFDMKDTHFAGHGHVKFTTEEAAQEALKFNNDLLLDNPVRLDLATERADHPTTTQAAGSKTLYLGNLSFAVEEDDVRDFFKDVGEIADIRFAIKDDRFMGYGHIDFTTAEAAQEALKLNNKVILDRRVKLELSRQRGGYTPGNRYNDYSIVKSYPCRYQAEGKTKTIYVRGFDSNDGFDNIRRALEKHFGKCGEITRVSIPGDYDSGGPRGVAFIDFMERNGVNQALGLHGSEIGGCRIIVEEARKQRGDGGWSSGGESGGGWVRESGWSRERDSRGGWVRERESSSSRQSWSGSSWSRESGSGTRWHSESYSGSGWGGRSGFGRGGGRASGYGFGGGWRSGSSFVGGGNMANSRRVGGGNDDGSGGGWRGYSGSGYSSSDGRVGRFSGGYTRRGAGPSRRP